MQYWEDDDGPDENNVSEPDPQTDTTNSAQRPVDVQVHDDSQIPLHHSHSSGVVQSAFPCNPCAPELLNLPSLEPQGSVCEKMTGAPNEMPQSFTVCKYVVDM